MLRTIDLPHPFPRTNVPDDRKLPRMLSDCDAQPTEVDIVAAARIFPSRASGLGPPRRAVRARRDWNDVDRGSAGPGRLTRATD